MAFVKFTGNTPFRPDPKPTQAIKQKPGLIKSRSKKRKVDEREYSHSRKEFLSLIENKKCFVEGCKRAANTIEHQKGRKGFADKWARDNDVGLLLDERYWKPCCLQHNQEFENNPELSKKYQLSQLHDGQKI